MQQRVVWSGQQILWLIAAELVEFHLACHYVQNVSKEETIKDMISICSEVKLAVPVIVGTQML